MKARRPATFVGVGSDQHTLGRPELTTRTCPRCHGTGAVPARSYPAKKPPEALKEAHNARQRDLNERTRATAVRNKEPWTLADVTVALDSSLTNAEAARRVGRTREAVKTLRRDHRRAIRAEETR